MGSLRARAGRAGVAGRPRDARRGCPAGPRRGALADRATWPVPARLRTSLLNRGREDRARARDRRRDRVSGQGRPGEARDWPAGRSWRRTARSIRCSQACPRSPIWPAEEIAGSDSLPAVPGGPIAARPAQAHRHARRLPHPPPGPTRRSRRPPGRRRRTRGAAPRLGAGDTTQAAVRLGVALRLEPGYAHEVLEAIGERIDTDPALALVAGDALRLLGRESEALAAFDRARGTPPTPRTTTRTPDDEGDEPPDRGRRSPTARRSTPSRARSDPEDVARLPPRRATLLPRVAVRVVPPAGSAATPRSITGPRDPSPGVASSKRHPPTPWQTSSAPSSSSSPTASSASWSAASSPASRSAVSSSSASSSSTSTARSPRSTTRSTARSRSSAASSTSSRRGPLVAAALEGPNAIAIVRAMNGATRPHEAAPGLDPRRLRGRDGAEPRPRVGQRGERRGRARAVVQARGAARATSARSTAGCSPRASSRVAPDGTRRRALRT